MVQGIVFQSTHPRGVRHNVIKLWVILPSFNPRTHEGCDLLILQILLFGLGFNPRTHEGCDTMLYIIVIIR